MIPSKQPKTPGASEKVTLSHNFFSKAAKFEVEAMAEHNGISIHEQIDRLRIDAQRFIPPAEVVPITGLDKEVAE